MKKLALLLAVLTAVFIVDVTLVPESRTQTATLIGPPGVNPRGVWSSSTTYNPRDSASIGATVYFSLTTNTNINPATDNGTNWIVWFSGGGPTGPQGPAGPANSLSIGTVTSGATPSATITGTAPSQTLSMTLQQGPTGATGATGATGGTVAITVSHSAPSGGNPGDLWFQY